MCLELSRRGQLLAWTIAGAIGAAGSIEILTDIYDVCTEMRALFSTQPGVLTKSSKLCCVRSGEDLHRDLYPQMFALGKEKRYG